MARPLCVRGPKRGGQSDHRRLHRARDSENRRHSAGRIGSVEGWNNQRYGVGVARLLWLLGKGSFLLPGGNLSLAYLALFSASEQSSLGPTSSNVATFVNNLRRGLAPCSTFRVRAVTEGGIWLRLRCGTEALESVISVTGSSPYLIDSISSSVATDPY